jgi:hypothetical protein
VPAGHGAVPAAGVVADAPADCVAVEAVAGVEVDVEVRAGEVAAEPALNVGSLLEAPLVVEVLLAAEPDKVVVEVALAGGVLLEAPLVFALLVVPEAGVVLDVVAVEPTPPLGVIPGEG